MSPVLRNSANDWWMHSRVRQTCMDHIFARVLSMGVIVRQGETERPVVLAGCAFAYRGYFLWVTAGHCIDVIDELDAASMVSAKWITKGDSTPEHDFPVDLNGFPRWRINRQGIDLGVGWIRHFPCGLAMQEAVTPISRSLKNSHHQAA